MMKNWWPLLLTVVIQAMVAMALLTLPVMAPVVLVPSLKAKASLVSPWAVPTLPMGCSFGTLHSLVFAFQRIIPLMSPALLLTLSHPCSMMGVSTSAYTPTPYPLPLNLPPWPLCVR